MLGSKIEKLFHVLDQTTEIIMQSCDLTYMEALVATGENLFQGEILQSLDDVAKKRVEKHYQSINLDLLTKEEIRRAFQLVTLKGMRDYVQPHHQMTPDSIGILMSGLIREFLANEKREQFTLLDPAIGTGNLVATIQNQLSEYAIEAYGIEVDDVLLKLAYVSANLQEQAIQLYNQDALEPLFIDPVDLVISDLPVGYYPRKEVAKEYELDRNEGHAFSHYLFIEQSLTYTKPGGLLFFVIPNDLFTGEEAPKLQSFLKKHAFIQGLIQLPLSMFKNERNAKSIFILKKKKDGETPPKQVFMAQMPKLTNKNAVQDVLGQIRAWFRKENK